MAIQKWKFLLNKKYVFVQDENVILKERNMLDYLGTWLWNILLQFMKIFSHIFLFLQSNAKFCVLIVSSFQILL